MPGDYDIEYTSPWAGADYLPSVTLGPNVICIESLTHFQHVRGSGQ
jgi:hypothetical protein